MAIRTISRATSVGAMPRHVHIILIMYIATSIMNLNSKLYYTKKYLRIIELLITLL